MAMLHARARIEILTHDSPLGHWQYGAWKPPDLAGVVDTLWYFDGRLEWPRERIFPHGHHEIIVHLGDVYREVQADGTTSYARTCFSGQMLRSLVIEAPAGRSAVLGIRLRPIGAWRLFGQGVHETTGLSVDLRDVSCDAATELYGACMEAPDAEARLRAAADWIRRRIAGTGESDPAVTWAADMIDRTHGRVPISEIRHRTGWSKTRFTRVFREQVGVPPKTLARITRFSRALGLLHRGTDRLSDVALSCGYYDQPHFNAEFRDVAGFTPSEYQHALRYPNSVSVAEGGA